MRVDSMQKKIAAAALFAVLAAVAGLIEGMLPLSLVLPLPGVKLGLANVFITAAFVLLGAKYAAWVMLGRVLVVFLFAGNPYAFVLSLVGGCCSFAGLMIAVPHVGKRVSYIGVSALSAAFHGIGQIVAATVFVGRPALSYLPVLGLACTGMGVLCGVLMNLFLHLVLKEGARHAD